MDNAHYPHPDYPPGESPSKPRAQPSCETPDVKLAAQPKPAVTPRVKQEPEGRSTRAVWTGHDNIDRSSFIFNRVQELSEKGLHAGVKSIKKGLWASHVKPAYNKEYSTDLTADQLSDRWSDVSTCNSAKDHCLRLLG